MIYQVNKDNMVFYVQDEEKALKYLNEGYDVFKQTKLTIGDDGNLEDDSSSIVKGKVTVITPERRKKK